MWIKKGGLQRRITLAATIGISLMVFCFGIVSYYLIEKNIEDTLNRRIALAHLIRNNIDAVIKENINRLYDISLSGSIDLRSNDVRPEKDALANAYRYSIFTDGIFLMDTGGNVLLNYPERMKDVSVNLLSVEPISRMIAMGKPVVSNIYTVEPVKRKLLYILVPLHDRNGTYVGVAGGEIDPTNPLLTSMFRLRDAGGNTFIDIIDSNGVVVASSNPSRALTYCDYNNFFNSLISAGKERVTSCHQCHVKGTGREKSTNMMAFVPLETAPWGVSIQEPEKDVYAPVVQLKWILTALGIVFIVTAFLLTWGVSRSIVNPIRELTHATERIAEGKLSTPLFPQGSDEIGVLGRSFESMRLKLVESMENTRRYNIELETRVKARTRQIKESGKRIQNLLKKIISSQEEERKRIARELHDVTLQELSAILMRLDICKLYPEKISREKIEEVRDITLKALDGVHTITQNLRPSVLDDLGLESAIGWLLDTHLKERGITYFFKLFGATSGMRFSPEVEISLFRTIQEAIVNIARHAKAENVLVSMELANKTVSVLIEDDGEGFDLDRLLQNTLNYKDGRGLGLLGMKERASFIGGTLRISSSQGSGTRIMLEVPLQAEEFHDA
ncbi:MAG: HAMP domain-containing protein [Thermodesulfovibrionales bacterium]|jgi:signal transduction histidine kinase